MCLGLVCGSNQEEEEVFIIAKNDLETHAHSLSGDAGADLPSVAGGRSHRKRAGSAKPTIEGGREGERQREGGRGQINKMWQRGQGRASVCFPLCSFLIKHSAK